MPMFEVTAPYGRTPSRTWHCLGCAAGEAGTAVGSREEAAGHVQATGHTVIVFHGTEELLTGLTTAPPGGQS